MNVVIKFLAKQPRNLPLVRQQLALSREFYRDNVRAVNARRAALDAAQKTHYPGLVEAMEKVDARQADLDTLYDTARQRNANARTKVKMTDAELADVKRIKAEMKELRATIKAIRGGNNVAFAAERETVNAEFYATKKRIYNDYSARGLFWGTMLRVSQNVEMADKRTPLWRTVREWTESTVLSVQLQKGLEANKLTLAAGDSRNILGACNGRNKRASVTDADTRLQLVWAETCRTSPRTDRPALLKLRCGSNPDRTPVFIDVPVWIKRLHGLPHGAFPAGTEITWASLVCRRVGVQDHWSVDLTCRLPGPWKTDYATNGQTVGIDLGWRLRDDGIRVAYWHGSDGRHGEFLLPKHVIGMRDKMRDLQSIRAKNFDAVKAKIVEYVQTLAAGQRNSATQNQERQTLAAGNEPQPAGNHEAATRSSAPWTLASQCSTLPQWRSPGRLCRVIDAWRDHRIPGDEAVFSDAMEWRKQERHLFQWERHEERKITNRRLWEFRQFVARMRREYQHIGAEDFVVSKLMRTPTPDKIEDEVSKEYQRLASIGLLRRLLLQDGAVKVETAGTTANCHACGAKQSKEWDRGKDLVHDCDECGERADQDDNAALIILARAEVVNESPAPARVPEDHANGDVATNGEKYVGRWTKRKEARSRKMAEMA